MKKIALHYMLLCVILLSSCIKEPVFDAQEQSAHRITFTLYNSSAAAQATKATRAVDELANETVVNRLDLFFFDTTGMDCLFYPDASQITIQGDQVTIRIPDDAMNTLYLIGNAKLYILANNQLERASLANKALDEIKRMALDNSPDYQFNQATPPADFLMDSEEIAVHFDEQLPNPNLGKIALKRAAAKVVVDITSARITGYTPMQARVTVVNYLDKTTLGAEFLYPADVSDYRSASKTLVPNGGLDNAFTMESQNPIYSYANRWEGSPEKETYLLIAFDWLKGGETIPKTYYYRIPFSYIQAQGDVSLHENRINRNYIYQFAINISRLGGLDPADAVDLAANFDLVNWTTKEVEVSILEYHFLFVYTPNVEMHNRRANVWEYKSSRHPISVEVTRVYCEAYDIYGGVHSTEYTEADPEYPQITTSQSGDRTYFSFESVIPENYVPLYMTANIRNSAGLSTEVSLTIYPKIYVTASYSYGASATALNPEDKGVIPAGFASTMHNGKRIWLAGSYLTPEGTSLGAGDNSPNGETTNSSPQKNFNFFAVHITSLDVADEEEGMRVGDPTESITHLGSTSAYVEFRDPVDVGQNLPQWQALSPYFRTRSDDDHNKIVSPQFVIASQRGITKSGKSWEVAQQRCATYRESQYAAATWRMPTLAELKLVRRMQLDPKSAIKELFQSSTTNGWWSSQQGASVILGDVNDATAIRTGHPEYDNSVRCVHDLWRD